jgi:hypothetical protein
MVPAGGPGRLGPEGAGEPPSAPVGSESTTAGSPGDAAIVFNVDAEKLPKAGDLKSYLFPSTVAVSVSEEDIQIVSRGAFPDLTALLGAIPMAAMTPTIQKFFDSPKASAKPGEASTAATQPPPTAAAPPGGGPSGKTKGEGAGARRRLRGDE